MRIPCRHILLTAATSLSLLLSACAPRTPVGTQATTSVSGELQAVVVAADKINRRMVLRGPDGNTATIDVPPEMRNFLQVMPGDTVRLTYHARVDLLVTGTSVPFTGVDFAVGAARSEPGQMPRGILGTQTRWSVQIVDVDRATHTVTFRDPSGRTSSITAMNPENFALVDGLRPGTNVVVTVTRALAASIDRV
jgi:FtsP/CotA-like multicopper oxidase with cupredoxin domain